MSEPPKKRGRQPRRQPTQTPTSTTTSGTVTTGEAGSEAASRKALTPEVLKGALLMMMPSDLMLVFDVRLLDAKGNELTQVFGASSMPGLALPDARPGLSMQVESSLLAHVSHPMVKQVQSKVQETLDAEEAALEALESKSRQQRLDYTEEEAAAGVGVDLPANDEPGRALVEVEGSQAGTA